MGKGKAKRIKIFAAPLNSALQQEKAKLTAAISDFWSSAGFQRHWSEPLFGYVDVKNEIASAADMVVRIRAYCARKHEPAGNPHTAGAAIEYLWSLHEKPTDLTAFESELVHACLMDENGYHAPLDEALVDQYIGEIRQLRLEAEEANKKPDVRAELEALHLLLDEISPQLASDEEAVSGLIEKIRDLNLYMEGIARRQQEVAEAARLHEEHLKQKAAEEEAAKQKEEQQKEEQAAASSDEEESSSSDSERARMKASIERVEQQEKKLLTIRKIADKTSTIAKDVQAFEEMDLPRLEQNLEPQERQGLLDRLTKRALEYSVKLERELLELDALQGEEVRPARKEQVLKIQEALRHCDHLQEQLKKYQPPPKEEEEEEEHHDEEKVVEPEPKKPKEKTLLERFASLRLDPRFQVRDGRAGYSVSAYVPGLDEEMLNISLNDAEDVLTCEGRRLPTEKELNVMRKQLRARYRYEPQEEDELLLRAGAGRFGSFSEKWRVDQDTMDAANIQASYQNGNLELFIPRRAPKMRTQPSFNRRAPQRGYPGGYQSPFYF